MTSVEKAEMLKFSIEHLYSKEGRSISYISRLLEINRSTLSKKIKEWNLAVAPPHRYAKPSTKKFINKHRNLIKSRLDNDISVNSIAKELKISRTNLVRIYIKIDEVLTKAYEDYLGRIESRAKENRQRHLELSSLNYYFEELPFEEWKPILGYSGYEVSNKGRIRKHSKRYKQYYLLKQQPNKNNGMLYIKLNSDEDKIKNLQVARIVAHSFVAGFNEEYCTVNHLDGDVSNNNSDNLAWVSQSDNNRHYKSYRKEI